MKKIIIIFLASFIFILNLFLVVHGLEYGWFENYRNYKTEYISTESEYLLKLKYPITGL